MSCFGVWECCSVDTNNLKPDKITKEKIWQSIPHLSYWNYVEMTKRGIIGLLQRVFILKVQGIKFILTGWYQISNCEISEVRSPLNLS